jgi:hypothetical protein
MWRIATDFIIIRLNNYQDELDKIFRRYQVNSAEELKNMLLERKISPSPGLQDYAAASRYELLIRDYKRQFYELLATYTPVF